MLMQQNVFRFLIIVIVCVEYFSECNGYHLIPPSYNNLTRFKRQSTCRRGQFTCNNGQCIPNYNYCDGKSDCSDESDEVLNCNTNGCASYTYRCAYGACVDGDSRCDGKQDCRDNSDEINCGGNSRPNNNCGSQFGCSSGECIDKYLVCDGLANCPDASDETYDLCNGIACQGYTFRCAYGACVDGDAKCDGKKDCIDNSDEDVKICGGGVSTTSESPVQGCAAPTIENGKFTVSGIGYVPGSLIKESSVITIECNAGYKLSGNNLLKCEKGLWSTEVPKCLSANVTPADGDCPAPDLIDNGKYEVLGTGQYTPGDPIPNFGILNFTCINKNYALVPANNLVYCISGKFQSELPKCVPSCAARFSTSIDVTCELNNVVQDCSKKVPEGTIATMKCKTHYVEINRGPSTAICSGGTWDVPLKQCFPECGELVPKGQTYVVNGTSAKKGEFPWHVAIYRETPPDPLSYICGGSIISVKIVISAAHCFADLNNGKLHPVNEFSLAAGKYFSNWNAPEDADFVQKRKISKIEIPKDIYLGYQSSYAGDVAVVVVVEPFVLTNLIKPVCVDWDSEYVETQLRSGAIGQVAGWGANIPGNIKASVDLKQLKVPYLDRGQCLEVVPQNFRIFITLDKYCAGYTNGSSVCSGDSGGGMVFPQEEYKGKKYYIQGVVSLGPQIDGACDDHQIGVYTKLQHHIQFIKKVEVSNRIN